MYKIPDVGAAQHQKFSLKRPFDFVGGFRGKLYAFELKIVPGRSLNINNLPEHQVEGLRRVYTAGGTSGFIVKERNSPVAFYMTYPDLVKRNVEENHLVRAKDDDVTLIDPFSIPGKGRGWDMREIMEGVVR
jgi:penicillin-binding protein-related factor A (putative recombinase)